jgi:hypothetical protein
VAGAPVLHSPVQPPPSLRPIRTRTHPVPDLSDSTHCRSASGNAQVAELRHSSQAPCISSGSAEGTLQASAALVAASMTAEQASALLAPVSTSRQTGVAQVQRNASHASAARSERIPDDDRPTLVGTPADQNYTETHCGLGSAAMMTASYSLRDAVPVAAADDSAPTPVRPGSRVGGKENTPPGDGASPVSNSAMPTPANEPRTRAQVHSKGPLEHSGALHCDAHPAAVAKTAAGPAQPVRQSAHRLEWVGTSLADRAIQATSSLDNSFIHEHLLQKSSSAVCNSASLLRGVVHMAHAAAAPMDAPHGLQPASMQCNRLGFPTQEQEGSDAMAEHSSATEIQDAVSAPWSPPAAPSQGTPPCRQTHASAYKVAGAGARTSATACSTETFSSAVRALRMSGESALRFHWLIAYAYASGCVLRVCNCNHVQEHLEP